MKSGNTFARANLPAPVDNRNSHFSSAIHF